jgi:sec-independent protein translocase protein TatA
MHALKPWHIIVLVLVVLLLFGAGKLPSLARNVGKSMRIFKTEVDELTGDKDKDADDEDGDEDERSRQKSRNSSKDADKGDFDRSYDPSERSEKEEREAFLSSDDDRRRD